ncbi:MAG: sulfurtransferase TusA family protein [Burkholderiaceae bacterium]
MRRAHEPAPPRPEVDLPGLGPTPIAQSVDCIGAMCPRPQLLTMKVLGHMQIGEVIEVRCDSAPAVEGFPALALSLTSTHLATIREPAGWRVYLRKGQ